MKRVIGTLALSLLLTACAGTNLGTVGGVNVSGAVEAASDLSKAATLSDDEVKKDAHQMRLYEEKTQEQVAPASSKYSTRLAKLTDRLRNYDGLNLNFKAYLSKDVNANATADGSIRVYTGLMDMMTDEELLFVLGHEIGHVKLGHSASEMRTALALSGIRKGAAASGTAAAAIADSELGGLLESFLNAQYSQSQETESDDYGLAAIKQMGVNPKAAVSTLRKLAKLSGGKHSMLSSHPEPNGRADRIEQMVK